MSRTAATLRGTTTDDAAALVGLWSALLRRGTRSDRREAMKEGMGRIAQKPAEPIAIADCYGAVDAAVILRTNHISRVTHEIATQAIRPHLSTAFPRHGLGD